MGYIKGYRDEVIIPDKYNTGCKGELVTAAEYFGSSYPDDGVLYITTSIQNTFGTFYENIHFDKTVTLNKPGLQSMIFRNCMFDGSGSYAINTGNNFDSENVTVTFENCEFLNQKSACVQPTKNFKLINCKIHNMGSDGGKVFDNGSYENCYFYNIGVTDGSHADGIQVTGANNNFSIINCRFDIPTYSGYISNAALFFYLEGDSYNSTIKDCVMTGGNYTLYYGRKYPDAETPVILENNTVENIIVGCSYNFGKLNDNSNSFDYNEVKDADKLFVSSVYKENEKIKLLVTNYTNVEKTLVIITDKGQTTHIIPACPLYADGKNNTSLSDFPFDVEIEVDGDYVVCYDTSATLENQIRYATFGANNDMTIRELFLQICNAIRTKDGSNALINHIEIPQRILDIETSNIGIVSLYALDTTKQKIEYYVNENFSTDDIRINAKYTDNSIVDVTSLANIDTSNVKTDVVGSYDINISYNEGNLYCFDNIEISIKATMAIDATKTNIIYTVGDVFSDDDITVIVAYEDGSTKDVTSQSIIDSSLVKIDQVGTYIINVSYTENDITVTDTIEVVVKSDVEETLPEQEYQYYGLFTGKEKDNEEQTMYVYVTSDTQKTMISSAGIWKLTDSSSNPFKMYTSYDKATWNLAQSTSSSTIKLNLATTYEYDYEGDILIETT